MKFALYTTCVSPHQMPLARAVASVLGSECVSYIAASAMSRERGAIGWGSGCSDSVQIINKWEDNQAAMRMLMTADVVMSGVRDVGLFSARCENGLITLYSSERWFKPWIGLLRLLSPAYLIMAYQFIRLLTKCDRMLYFPMGIHAARDMARICGLMHGDIRCLFRAPELCFESKPGGKIWLKNGDGGDKYCVNKMRMWGYFVEPSRVGLPSDGEGNGRQNVARVLWVGRLLRLKRVDTIIRAVVEYSKRKRVGENKMEITLDIYGNGPESARLRRMASKYSDVVRFFPPVQIDQVRGIMREHNIYVLASDGHEGWGAVVNEALEEGMAVLGTNEAGSTATMLHEDRLFHAGDWRCLMNMIDSCLFDACAQEKGIGAWSVKNASNEILSYVETALNA